MGRTRGFEVAKGYEKEKLNLPLRATRHSAGFDFEAAETIVIEPLWRKILKSYRSGFDIRSKEELEDGVRPTKVSTGIKAYMGDDEVLYLFNRSSHPFTKFLILADGVGVVDADYYGCEKNDGNIFFQFINFGLFSVTIEKGERIGQGVFSKFYDTDEGKSRKSENKRTGGSGTT